MAPRKAPTVASLLREISKKIKASGDSLGTCNAILAALEDGTLSAPKTTTTMNHEASSSENAPTVDTTGLRRSSRIAELDKANPKKPHGKVVKPKPKAKKAPYPKRSPCAPKIDAARQSSPLTPVPDSPPISVHAGRTSWPLNHSPLHPGSSEASPQTTPVRRSDPPSNDFSVRPRLAPALLHSPASASNTSSSSRDKSPPVELRPEITPELEPSLEELRHSINARPNRMNHNNETKKYFKEHHEKRVDLKLNYFARWSMFSADVVEFRRMLDFRRFCNAAEIDHSAVHILRENLATESGEQEVITYYWFSKDEDVVLMTEVNPHDANNGLVQKLGVIGLEEKILRLHQYMKEEQGDGVSYDDFSWCREYI